jgi:glycosyltransferase involved in cell wall biosynthesis
MEPSSAVVESGNEHLAQPMNILMLVHHPPTAGASMQVFSETIQQGLRRRGHQVRIFTAPVVLTRLARPGSALAKWLGYLDQFVLFPPLLWWTVQQLPTRTLVVVADQALGPWVPLIRHHPHLIHCHDLLALESSLGRWPTNPVATAGCIYQRLIRWGFRHGRVFLSVSAATQSALKPHLPGLCELNVLPNPLDSAFHPASENVSLSPIPQPYLLHVGSTWYKNRPALLQLFSVLISRYHWPQLQLVLVGAVDPAMAPLLASPALQGRVCLLDSLPQARLVELYQQAEALLFPSLAEGFGWPPLEALACGCPAVISPIEPLRSLTAGAATLFPPFSQPHWAEAAAAVVDALLRRSPAQRQAIRARGLAQAARFSLDAWLDALEAHYTSVSASGRLAASAPPFPLPA